MKRVRVEERGAAAVEFAIVALFLITLLFGILTYGFVFSLEHNLNHAATEGARAANAAPVGTEVTVAAARARDALSNDLARAHAVIDAKIVDPCDGSTPGLRCIDVTITYDYDTYPIVPELISVGVPDTMSARAELVLD